jgi:hypothetical protein
LFTGSAVGAITSETRGQNSRLNYGPYGEANRTAKVEDTVFAEQKTGLMPEWIWNEGRAGDEEVAGVPAPNEAPRVEPVYEEEIDPAQASGSKVTRAKLHGRLHEKPVRQRAHDARRGRYGVPRRGAAVGSERGQCRRRAG